MLVVEALRAVIEMDGCEQNIRSNCMEGGNLLLISEDTASAKLGILLSNASGHASLSLAVVIAAADHMCHRLIKSCCFSCPTLLLQTNQKLLLLARKPCNGNLGCGK